MHALGIPTTRALCITGSDAPVYRETVETAAVLTRVAPTHVRFGSFELFFYRNQNEQVRELADYVIAGHYPHLTDSKDKYLEFLRELIERTARLIARWQSVGFAHGVMNTDNMSIVGLTIDYGPFGFLDEFDGGFICNHSDYGGRYAFDQQPAVALWNLSCLAQTLLPLIDRETAVAALNEYQPIFSEEYFRLMHAKLGLKEEHPEDNELIASLLEILQANLTDYTRFFRRLGDFKQAPPEKNSLLQGMFVDPARFDRWARDYKARLTAEAGSADEGEAERRRCMMQVNPKYILRNHIAQEVIEQAQKGDYGKIDELLKVLQNPFDEQPEMERYAEPPAEGSRRVVVSCSS
jgi:uncharacterized protein YdiU (UPF0061 family)